MRAYSSYCESNNRQPFPVSIDFLLNFIGHLFSQKVSCSTAKVYLCGISHYSVLQGGSPLLSDFRIHMALRGFSRLTAGRPDKRLPVSVGLMAHIKKKLDIVVPSFYDSKLFWCAFNLAFFGFL